MNNDLVMQAIVAFNGEWPNYGWGDLEKDDQVIGLCTESYKEEFGTFVVGEYYQIGVKCDKSVWKIACTRSEFETRLQELADAAPEGATHYRNNQYSKWYKKTSDGFAFYFEGWLESNSFKRGEISESDLIPLPPKTATKEACDLTHELKGEVVNQSIVSEMPKAKELTAVAGFVPEVGQEFSIKCDYMLCGANPFKLNKGDTVIVKAVVNLGFGDVALISDPKITGSGTIIFSQLEPLKTEAEKERERLYQELYDMETGMGDYQINRVIEFIQGRDND